MKTPEERKVFLNKLREAASEADDMLGSCDASDILDALEVSRDYLFEVGNLIEQLEAELADAKRNHQHTIDIAEKQKEQIGKLKKLVVRLYKEKKAAIIDCSEFPCKTCDDRENRDLCCTCIKPGNTRRVNYVWRGVCPENTEESQ